MIQRHHTTLALSQAVARVYRAFGKSHAMRFAFVLPDREGPGATLYRNPT